MNNFSKRIARRNSGPKMYGLMYVNIKLHQKRCKKCGWKKKTFIKCRLILHLFPIHLGVCIGGYHRPLLWSRDLVSNSVNHTVGILTNGRDTIWSIDKLIVNSLGKTKRNSIRIADVTRSQPICCVFMNETERPYVYPDSASVRATKNKERNLPPCQKP